jgi:hypothetical protein
MHPREVFPIQGGIFLARKFCGDDKIQFGITDFQSRV